MKTKLILCLALVLNGGLFGCSTAERQAAKSSRADLYLQLIASYEYPEPPRLMASVPVHLSKNFNFLTDDQQHLTGWVEPRNGKYFVHFQVYLYDGTNVFDGEVDLDKPDDPGPQPYNDKTPFIYQPMFVLSRNASASPFLKRQAVAEEKEWQRENPLTPQQITEVYRRFRLMKTGMTESEVFAMLGLSRYRRRLIDPRMFRSNDWNIDDYQLAHGEILSLAVACPGSYKTNFIKLPDGRRAMEIGHGGYGDNHGNCIVVHAALGAETWSDKTGFGMRQRSR